VDEFLARRGQRREFDVVVTSYEGVLKEKGSLTKIMWRYVIIDEVSKGL